MTKNEMDKLKVGDEIEIYKFNPSINESEWIPATVTRVIETMDNKPFSHGGFHSVYTTINGYIVVLENETTRIKKKKGWKRK